MVHTISGLLAGYPSGVDWYGLGICPPGFNSLIFILFKRQFLISSCMLNPYLRVGFYEALD